MLPARRVPGFLHIQTKINLVCEDLYMTLRLHAAAHDTESFPRFAVFHHESWNNGVKRALTGRVDIRVLWVHRKKLAAILKHESKTRHNDPAAHPAIIALDERHHVAFIVRSAHVNRVAIIYKRTGAGPPSGRNPSRATRGRVGSILRAACLYSFDRVLRVNQFA